VWVEHATPNYFSVLSVRPALGRAFSRDEGTSGRERVVVLSDGLWLRLGQPALGTVLRLDDVEHEVIGVLPGSFRSPHEFSRLEPVVAYVPLVFSPKDLSPEGHGDHDLDAAARLKPGVTLAAAQADLDRISAWLAKTYPDTNAQQSARVTFLREDITRGVRTSLLILLGAVGLVWLVASVNLANLLLVRALGRQREVTVRAALGAGRLRLVQGLLTQSLLLSTCGCIAGLALGWQLSALLRRIAPPGIPRLDALGVDFTVFAVMAAVSTAAGVLFGLFPSLHLSKTSPIDALRAPGSHLSAPFVVRWRSALVVAEIALSLVLLTAGGLLLRSFVTMTSVDLGFSTEQVLTLNINLPASRYATPGDRLRFFEALTDRVRAVPGVDAAGFANRFPMRGGWGGGMFFDDSKEPIEVNLQAVSPGYFSTLGIPLLQGRVFESSDRLGSRPVAVINSSLARMFFAGREPVGQYVRRSPETPPVAIVGVVGDIRRGGKAAKILPEMYFSAAQTDMYPVILADYAVRTRSDPRTLLPAIREAVRSIDPNQPIGNVRTLGEVVDTSVAQRRFEMLLILLFAGVALALTLVGIYGVVSFAVGQRTREFGLRVALGARPGDILSMVLRQAALMIVIGLTIGLAGAYAVGQLVKTLLFETPPDDPATFAVVSGLLAVVALSASLVPALRASTIDPVSALRAD
jgi:predicted permease